MRVNIISRVLARKGEAALGGWGSGLVRLAITPLLVKRWVVWDRLWGNNMLRGLGSGKLALGGWGWLGKQ